MGIVKLPNYRLYWSINKIMSRDTDRFLNIMSFFHACNNSTQTPSDDPTFKGYKVRDLSRMLLSNWRLVYIPSRVVAVDECLIPFKGRTKFLQYIPSKPHKWGIKAWCLSESGTGHVLNWSLYTGSLPADNTHITATHRVVMSLTEPLLNKGHHVYMDNFFSSPALYKELAEKVLVRVELFVPTELEYPKLLKQPILRLVHQFLTERITSCSSHGRTNEKSMWLPQFTTVQLSQTESGPGFLQIITRSLRNLKL